jgi:hypothetical protein
MSNPLPSLGAAMYHCLLRRSCNKKHIPAIQMTTTNPSSQNRRPTYYERASASGFSAASKLNCRNRNNVGEWKRPKWPSDSVRKHRSESERSAKGKIGGRNMTSNYMTSNNVTTFLVSNGPCLLVMALLPGILSNHELEGAKQRVRASRQLIM